MQHLLLFATAALLSSGCGSDVSQIQLLQIDKTVQPNVIPPKDPIHERRIIQLQRRPAPINPHPPGTTLELTCDATGAPAPTVHWYRNQLPVYEHDLESNEIVSTNPSSLARVTSTLLVTRTEGEDEYTCLVTTGLSTVKASTIVYSTDDNTDLSERSKLLPLAPRIVGMYKVYMDTIGNDIVLPCKAKGHPRPHITWVNKKGISVKKDPRMKVLRSGELLISPLRWSDMGEYTCRVSNVFGSETASTFVYPARAG